MPDDPVQPIPVDEPEGGPAPWIGLCLSGGSYRAMVFRKRHVIDAFKSGARKGTNWGIRTNIQDYGLPDTLPCPFARTTALAESPTRLKRLDHSLQERLIHWDYTVCDAALRKHVDPALPKPNTFPYVGAGV